MSSEKKKFDEEELCGLFKEKNQVTPNLTEKQKLVDEIFKPNKEGISNWKTRKELESTSLKLTLNGNSRNGFFYNDKRYIWEKFPKRTKLLKLRTIGLNKKNNTYINRAIHPDIKKYWKKFPCCVCGTKSNLECDHKNDLYNDGRISSMAGQKIEDFQSLCGHCNSRKRQVMIKVKELGKRYGATNIPMLKTFGIDFIKGGDTYDPHNINAMEGTFWYDPVSFMECVKKKVIKKYFLFGIIYGMQLMKRREKNVKKS